MPCTDGGDEIDDSQSLAALACALIRAFAHTGIGGDDPFNYVDWKEAGVTAKWARAWWAEHQREDAERRKMEREAREREAFKKKALSKLSLRERKALGWR